MSKSSDALHAILASCLLAATVHAASLTTGYQWDSGWCAGPHMDLTAASSDITVDSFDMYFRGMLPRDVSVYYKAGTYVGFELMPGAWTQIGTVSLVPLGDGILTPVPLGGFTIPAGQTYGVKVWDHLGTGGAMGGGLILKSGGSTASNPDLSLSSLYYTCSDPWSGLSSPWGWEGTVNYTTGRVIVQSVTSTFPTVYPGQTGIDLQVAVENAGPNLIDLQSVDISFTDSMAADRTSEYLLTPDPGQPTSIAPGATVLLDWTVDVLLIATPETITIDAGVTALDTVTMQPVVDPDADMPHVWTVQGCGFSLCGDCDGNTRVDILDALLAAQISAGLQMSPAFGSPQFNECNAQGAVFPDPMSVIDILDALELARAAAGLSALSCC